MRPLAIHPTRERAEERVKQARRLPAFRDKPECLLLDGHELDEDTWTEGFH